MRFGGGWKKEEDERTKDEGKERKGPSKRSDNE
jgi:hypothetical protein